MYTHPHRPIRRREETAPNPSQTNSNLPVADHSGATYTTSVPTLSSGSSSLGTHHPFLARYGMAPAPAQNEQAAATQTQPPLEMERPLGPRLSRAGPYLYYDHEYEDNNPMAAVDEEDIDRFLPPSYRSTTFYSSGSPPSTPPPGNRQRVGISKPWRSVSLDSDKTYVFLCTLFAI